MLRKLGAPLLMIILATIIDCCRTSHQNATVVVFPVVDSAVQITDDKKEHFFASYFGINSFNRSERYATVLETDLKFVLPDETQPATLGLVDLQTKAFIPLTKTRAWNFQQGCMAHWLGSSPDSLIIFNDFRDRKFVSVILNVYSKKEIKIIPYPVSAVSPDGKEAISINFARIRVTNTEAGYGYGGQGQDAKRQTAFPAGDGLFLVNLETGQAKLIVSYEQVKDMVPPLEQDTFEWFNHTLFSRGGTKIFWISRQKFQNTSTTTAFTVNKDGSNLQRCFPDHWEGSHFDWLTDDRLLVNAMYDGKQYSHVLFTVGKRDYQRLGNGLLDYDGHGTFSPNGKWMVTDTYPDDAGEQRIYLMDMKTQAVLPLGRYAEPKEYYGAWRCDIHCRWSPKGDIIGFNSTHTGSRQAYILRLKDKRSNHF